VNLKFSSAALQQSSVLTKGKCCETISPNVNAERDQNQFTGKTQVVTLASVSYEINIFLTKKKGFFLSEKTLQQGL